MIVGKLIPRVFTAKSKANWTCSHCVTYTKIISSKNYILSYLNEQCLTETLGNYDRNQIR